jgi:hypothetical protein
MGPSSSKGDMRRTAGPAISLSRANYRYPRVSDRKLDFVSLGATAAVAVLSLVFVPSPWRYPLIALELIVLAVRGIKVRRHYRPAPSFFATNHQEAMAREALIKQHFTVLTDAYMVACTYCDWKTTDYAHRLLEAPRHLHDEHPSRDPRIPSWLRHEWTAWLGRLVTRG